MNDQQTAGRRHHHALLLLIPAAVLLAKGAHRRRTMWAQAEDESGDPLAGGQAHAGPFRMHGGRFPMHRGVGLPPHVERRLEAWHQRAHAAEDASSPA